MATLLGSNASGYVPGQTYAVRIEVSGGQIRVKVDGVDQFAVSDNALASGSVAMYSWGNAGSFFDDVVVTGLTSGPAVPPVPSVPSAPAGLVAKVKAGNQVDLSWTNTAANQTGFRIERKTAGGTYGKMDTVAAGLTTYSDKGTVSSTTYLYRVCAYNKTGSSLYSNEVTVKAGELLKDDFSDGFKTGWIEASQGKTYGPADWRETGGRLEQWSNLCDESDRYPLFTNGRVGTYLYWKDPDASSWSNYAVDVKMRSDDNDGIGLMFYYRDSTNYYRFEMDSQRGFRKLIRKANGIVTLLGSNASGYVPGRTYAVRIEVSGGQIRVKVDGVDQFAVSDNALASGSVAMYSWGNAGSFFDDVAVTGLAGGFLYKESGDASRNSQNDLPEIFNMAQNYPNPFNLSTRIEYNLPEAGSITIRIYDNRGRKIITLIDDEEKSAGMYSVYWDGKDWTGTDIPSGFILCRIAYRGQVLTRKMTLMKSDPFHNRQGVSNQMKSPSIYERAFLNSCF